MNKVFKVGLIGCGHISETYFRAQEYFNNIKIIKCADINMDSAKKCAIHYNIEAVTVEEILKDFDIELSEIKEEIIKNEAELVKQIKQNQIDQLAAGHHGVPLSVYKENYFFGQDKFDDLIENIKLNGGI